MKRNWDRMLVKISYILLNWCHKRIPPRIEYLPVNVGLREIVTVSAKMRCEPVSERFGDSGYEKRVKYTLAKMLIDEILASEEIVFEERLEANGEITAIATMKVIKINKLGGAVYG
ncbi:hypothetical protein [Listeria booriae]|uniref:hypothetical protein n=1 Tax=Listeria booriae TaxID=1552123 RepID=UPI00162906AE|nr:hypothetical protein [Listeria booriae]MBC1974542.1 hypothetical protein [Listeria booriae]MBC1983474.1 hypothetical protein [Listeria booriae]MBC2031834.1 hypothetical protein [Listeria booriae]